MIIASGEQTRAAGGTAAYVVCDLADASSVRAAVDRAVNRYGRLDIAAIRTTAGTGAVVNNSSVGSLMGNAELPAPPRPLGMALPLFAATC